ncbi:hypothetical protein LZ31DRAFT_105915 [Colletotrichum somersetense]|nr:hypothetical protein LZ31DRAFT_105915 [Colletotrichum somersetense]
MKPRFSCATVFQLATLLKPIKRALPDRLVMASSKETRWPGRRGPEKEHSRAGSRRLKNLVGGRDMPTHQTKQRGTAVMAGHPSKSFAHRQGAPLTPFPYAAKRANIQNRDRLRGHRPGIRCAMRRVATRI